jgi:hypothetical protein
MYKLQPVESHLKSQRSSPSQHYHPFEKKISKRFSSQNDDLWGLRHLLQMRFTNSLDFSISGPFFAPTALHLIRGVRTQV